MAVTAPGWAAIDWLAWSTSAFGAVPHVSTVAVTAGSLAGLAAGVVLVAAALELELPGDDVHPASAMTAAASPSAYLMAP
ncbi:hypothetical protein GCM10009826_04060 [Humibacillus xanthopallidus]